jgi:hypothetical protein
LKVNQLLGVIGVRENHCREDGKKEEADALSLFSKILLSKNPDTETVHQFVQRVKKAQKQARKVIK